MNYEQAKAIIAEHEELGLLLDPEVPGQAHICVRKSEKGEPFSIMLPKHPMPPPIAYRVAVPEILPVNPGDVHQLAQPEVAARTSQELLEEVERESLMYSLRAAVLHL